MLKKTVLPEKCMFLLIFLMFVITNFAAVSLDIKYSVKQKYDFIGCWNLVYTPIKIKNGHNDFLSICFDSNKTGMQFSSNGRDSGSISIIWEIKDNKLRFQPDYEDSGSETSCDFKVIDSDFLYTYNCSVGNTKIKDSYYKLQR